ncbi:unknown [Firmicutes bacterium CAG:791]|nr:unknown [Firmicutes bacterium CAG:791]
MNILICLDIAGVYNAFSLILDVCGLGLVGLTGVLDRQALDVHDDIRNIFFYTRNRAELMLNTIDFDLADCRARK